MEYVLCLFLLGSLFLHTSDSQHGEKKTEQNKREIEKSPATCVREVLRPSRQERQKHCLIRHPCWQVNII